MTYLQKSRRSKKKSPVAAMITAVIVIAISLTLVTFSGKFIGWFAVSTGGPVASAFTSFKNKLSFAGSFLGSRSSLIEENRRLKAEAENTEAKLIRFDTLSREYETLLSAYGRSPFAGAVVLGNIIVKPPQSPYDVIIADIGKADGIAPGTRVYGLGGIPVGRVAEVTDSTSKIVMLTSVDEKNEVILERTGDAISITGIGGGNMKAEVSQETDIAVGDAIILPQFAGAVVAFVVEVDSNVTSATKTVLFRAPINVFHIRWVEILKTTH